MNVTPCKNKTNGSVAAGIFAFLGIMVLIAVYSIFSYGYVGMIFWSWFVVPVFGVPALTMYQSWGLATMVSLWTHQTHTDKQDDERTSNQKIGALVLEILKPWLIFAIVALIRSIWL